MKLAEAQITRVRELETARGEITPRAVVEDAKDKSSPLHDLFEWNKTKAAEAHWLQVGREIIGSVMYSYSTRETIVKSAHYVRDPDAQGQGYRSVVSLRSEPEAARQSLIYTLEVAAGHLRRAQNLAEPLGMVAEIDTLLERILGVQRLIRTAA